jgi:hypothetical protein
MVHLYFSQLLSIFFSGVLQSLLTAKPWDKDPHFFKDIKISALALLKMVMHAR